MRLISGYLVRSLLDLFLTKGFDILLVSLWSSPVTMPISCFASRRYTNNAKNQDHHLLLDEELELVFDASIKDCENANTH